MSGTGPYRVARDASIASRHGPDVPTTSLDNALLKFLEKPRVGETVNVLGRPLKLLDIARRGGVKWTTRALPPPGKGAFEYVDKNGESPLWCQWFTFLAPNPFQNPSTKIYEVLYKVYRGEEGFARPELP